MEKATYRLTLHKTYYDKGFFNLGVEVERFVRAKDGPITLLLGTSSAKLVAQLNREANQNNTPRIMGGIELRNWFHKHYRQGDVLEVKILTEDRLQLG